MPGSTSPLGIPYPVAGDSLRDAVSTIPQAMAEQIDDLIAGLSAVGPSSYANLVLSVGWGGFVARARASSITTVVVAATKSSFVTHENIGTLPVGYRPGVRVSAAAGYGTDFRAFYVDPDGKINCAANGATGIYGHATFVSIP